MAGPVNNITSVGTPQFQAMVYGQGNSATISATTGQSPAGNTSAGSQNTSLTLGCVAHTPNNAALYPRINNTGNLNFTGNGNTIYCQEINSLEVVLVSLSNFWKNVINQRINSTPPSFVPKTNNDKIIASDWNQVRNCLAAFETLSTAIASTVPGTVSPNDTIQAAYYNDLANAFNIISHTCACNSDCACNIVCTCNYNCGCNYSDIRLKQNIKSVTKSEAKELLELEIVKYNYKSTYDIKEEFGLEYHFDSKQHYGIIAQHLKGSKIESLLQEDNNGLYNVDYQSMIPLLIKNIQELQKEVLELKYEIKRKDK